MRLQIPLRPQPSAKSALPQRRQRALHLIRRAASVLIAVGLAAAQLGCGYALVGRGSNIPEDVQEVLLKPLENETTRSEVEQFLSQAIAEELVTRQRFRLVTEESDADAVLEGSVIDFRVTPVTFDAEGRGEEYEITIVSKMSFHRTDEDETSLWANERYIFKENYELEASEASFFDRENLAIEESAGRFAETVITDLLEGF